MIAKVKEPVVSVLSYEEYQEAVAEGRVLRKYYIVDALQNYVFCHTNNRLSAYEWFKLNYPIYTMRTVRQDSGNGTGCSATCSTRRGQSKFKDGFGVPEGLR